MRAILHFVVFQAICVLSFPTGAVAADSPTAVAKSPEAKAIAFLVEHVPRWRKENGCYSCHNNGDAARALYRAAEMKYEFDRESLADTTDWLTHPERWKDNGGDGEFSDKLLADVQFAAALAEAVRTGAAKDRTALRRAAEIVVERQDEDGSWIIRPQTALGSPATWGRTLATVMSRETLVTADAERFAPAIRRADEWLKSHEPKTVVDAAALLALSAGVRNDEQRRASRRLIRDGEDEEGGWGPFTTSPPEPFDTALVLLALAPRADDAEITPLLRRGRAYLLRIQLEDGSWPETTRPAGAESYAQRLSTTGWATLALFATR
ncbi:MAG: hypothetical protein WD066_01045 [Planctomycetaceae bacterium]